MRAKEAPEVQGGAFVSVADVTSHLRLKAFLSSTSHRELTLLLVKGNASAFVLPFVVFSAAPLRVALQICNSISSSSSKIGDFGKRYQKKLIYVKTRDRGTATISTQRYIFAQTNTITYITNDFVIIIRASLSCSGISYFSMSILRSTVIRH